MMERSDCDTGVEGDAEEKQKKEEEKREMKRERQTIKKIESDIFIFFLKKD